MDESESGVLNLELIYSWGFDGSTGQAQYNMSSPGTDSSLFATTAIPLKLHDQNNTTIWMNPAPASTHFVRPIRLEFAKESKEFVLSQHADLQQQIDGLHPLEVLFDDGRVVNVSGKFLLTLLDGKCLAFLTGTPSMASCPLCQAKPSMLNITDSKNFVMKEGAAQYGISPLHFCIRSLEAVLKLSYRLELQKWAVGSAIIERKKAVQSRIRAAFNVIVDMPRDGGAGTDEMLTVVMKPKFDLFPTCIETIPRQILRPISCNSGIHSPSLSAALSYLAKPEKPISTARC